MLGRRVIGWLSLDTKTRCTDFDLSARAGVLALEREVHPSSISCAVWDARAWSWPLERGYVSAARAGRCMLVRRPGAVKVLGVCSRRSSGSVDARADVCE